MERAERLAQLNKMYDGIPVFLRHRVEKAVHELWDKESTEPFITRAAWCRIVVREELDGYPIEMRKELLTAILLKMQEKYNLVDADAYRTAKTVLDDVFSSEENGEGKWGKWNRKLMGNWF